MEALRFFAENAGKLILGAIGFLVYYYAYGTINAELFDGWDKPKDYAVSFAIMTTIFVYSISGALKLIGLRKLRTGFMRSIKWVACAALILFVVYTAFDRYSAFKGSGTNLYALLKLSGLIFAGYIAYSFAGKILCFFGNVFIQLGDAVPKGRVVLFNETLNNGYSKPQIRAFIGELNVANAGTYAHSTLILYGIPLLAALVAWWN